MKFDITYCVSKTCTRISKCDRSVFRLREEDVGRRMISVSDFSTGVEDDDCEYQIEVRDE